MPSLLQPAAAFPRLHADVVPRRAGPACATQASGTSTAQPQPSPCHGSAPAFPVPSLPAHRAGSLRSWRPGRSSTRSPGRVSQRSSGLYDKRYLSCFFLFLAPSVLTHFQLRLKAFKSVFALRFFFFLKRPLAVAYTSPSTHEKIQVAFGLVTVSYSLGVGEGGELTAPTPLE